MSKLLDAIGAVAWAMTPEALQQIHDIAARENELTPEALAKIEARELARSERATRRGGTAILSLEGPMFKKANFFVQISGATSYEIIRRDLQVALDDPSITSILLDLDTPGGEASGADDLSNAIYEARSKKHIVAYVGGNAASAGYWIGSAAHEIVMSSLALVGSIGAVAGITDTSERDAKSGVRRFSIVSSQSPNKAVDPTTNDGRAQIQTVVDDMAQVFIETVARNRNVTVETVLESFGQGGVFIASKACALGMADRISTFESVIDDLNSSGVSGRPTPRSQGGFHMTQQTNSPAAVATGITAEAHAAALDSARKEAAGAAQTRIAAIIGSAEGKASPKLAEHLAFKTSMSADDAKATLAASGADKPSAAPAPTPAQQSYTESRANTNGLAIVSGVNETTDDRKAVKASWSKAVASANLSRVGS